jgi:hypothetical protein
MPGSTIAGCDHKEFDQLTVPLGQNKNGEGVEKLSRVKCAPGLTTSERGYRIFRSSGIFRMRSRRQG